MFAYAARPRFVSLKLSINNVFFLNIKFKLFLSCLIINILCYREMLKFWFGFSIFWEMPSCFNSSVGVSHFHFILLYQSFNILANILNVVIWDIFKQKSQYSLAAQSNVSSWPFMWLVSWKSLGFGLLIRQCETFENTYFDFITF